MTECNCMVRPDEGRDGSVCNSESKDGYLCSKPENHEGPHSACNVAQHPMEVWEDD